MIERKDKHRKIINCTRSESSHLSSFFSLSSWMSIFCQVPHLKTNIMSVKGQNYKFKIRMEDQKLSFLCHTMFTKN